MSLANWLTGRVPEIRDQWRLRIEARESVGGAAWEEVIGSFITLITAMLVPAVGPLRREIEPYWVRVAELFGRTAAGRGLAAGEVIEELQILRELVIRDLYRDPPGDAVAPLSLRDVLLLNRAVDRLVTYGSVSHTDALFFDLLEAGDGESRTEIQSGAVVTELAAIRREVQQVLTQGGGAPLVVESEH